MAFHFYSDDNPPKRGNGKLIYDAFKQKGFTVKDLHYNPNCWGNSPENGWGTWACEIIRPGIPRISAFCGIVDGRVYVQSLTAPFHVIWMEDR